MKRKIGYILIIIFFICGGIFLLILKDKLLKEEDEVKIFNDKNDAITIKDANDDNNENKKQEVINTITKLLVDIKGAIVNPGVYEVDKDTRVNDVIIMAGGLLDNADTSLINLSKKVSDEMVIIIYTKEEVANSNMVNTVIKEVEKECVCPNIENDACLNEEITDDITEIKKVSLNNASENELMIVNGIGQAKAKAIIKYRLEHGHFNDVSELLNVDGIGEALYNKIKDYFTL